METRDHENTTLAFLTEGSTMSPKVDDLRERIKIEFYKTYDVMTGVRIAATLGGFFSMMILLVLYKNYCKPSKTLSEEQLNAAVTAAAEEEDRALQAALEATSFYTSLGKPRQSLDNTNQFLLSPRFSSVGGGYSHLTPPLKVSVLQQRGKSLPGSVLRFGSGGSPSSFQQNEKNGCFSKDEEFDLDCHTSDYFNCRNYLSIPANRRVSSVTCSSADSSYLERRCSAFEIGYPSSQQFTRQSQEKLQEKKEPWNYYYPIDIQVIQPTPEMSPTASERNLHEEQTVCGLQVPGFQDQMHRLSVTSFDIGLAPLASISSLGSFSSQSSSSKGLNSSTNNVAENPGCTCAADDSLGSDSVFMDDLELDYDPEEFATDSEFEYDGFDDDYSFCESKERPVSRTEIRSLQFASFDSYDASIMQDSVSENLNTEATTSKEPFEDKGPSSPKPVLSRQHSTDLRRHPSLHEGNKIRRKLVKTNSEPRNSRVLKQLPPWIEKGRSGFIPKRQMSSPSAKKQNILTAPTDNSTGDKTLDLRSKKESTSENQNTDFTKNKTSQEDENAKELAKIPSSQNSSSSDSVTLTPNLQKSNELLASTSKQGFDKYLPSKNNQSLSVPNAQEKRSRLQKQKNFIEDVKISTFKEKTEEQRETGDEDSRNFPVTFGEFLKLPNVSLSGSCERLAAHSLCEDNKSDVSDIKINMSVIQSDELESTSSYTVQESVLK